MRLKGKVAIVTGAGQGIGRAIALIFAKEGADVVVADVNLEGAEKVADEIKVPGHQAQAIKVDVSTIGEVNQMVKKVVDNFNKIDILVNNVHGEVVTPTVKLTEAQWDTVFNTGVKGVFLCSQAVGRQMIKQKRGKIINIASISGHAGMPGQAAYSASKAGILSLTRSLGIEWAKYNINVNAVSPGVTITPRVEDFVKKQPELYKRYFERIPSGRPARPEEQANAVLFLASSESDDIVGQEIIVDGGVRALHPGYITREAVTMV